MKYDFWKWLKREKSEPSVVEESSAAKRVREWSRYGRGVRHIAVGNMDKLPDHVKICDDCLLLTLGEVG